MGLISNHTRWIFILPSPHLIKTEERHIQDIAFGVHCLLKKGIKQSNIDIFIDNNISSVTDYILTLFNVPLSIPVLPTNSIKSIMGTNKKRNAVVFITGHGSPEGMVHDIPIKPFEFYDIFQTAPNLKKTVFYFGQCYAGIFNYMPLSTHLNHSDKHMNNMVAIGATGLFPSISYRYDLNKNVFWTANIFLLNIFKWILNMVDVDGDHKYSIMDSFKYASIITNETIQQIKKDNTLESMIEVETLLEKIKTAEDRKSLSLELEIESIDKKMSFMNAIQESWILNTPVAMTTEF